MASKPRIVGGKIPDTTRNSTLASLAGTLRRQGLGEEEIRASLLILNERFCDPPLGEAEVLGIAQSISRYPTGKGSLPVLTVQEMMSLPSSEWLVDGIIPKDALVVLCGPPAQFKSFMALDWSMCIAAGIDWNGHGVRQEPVLYIVAEGANGYGPRMSAWLHEHGLTDVPNSHFIPTSIQLVDAAEVQLLIDTISGLGLKPGLIVIDTLARCFVGGDENSAKEMGMLVDAAERIRAATGASVMLVHHTGKSGELRGSTALPGAAYTIIGVKKMGKASVRIRCIKTKDATEFPTMQLRWKPVADSGVLEFEGAKRESESQPTARRHEFTMLSALAAGPLRNKDLQAAASRIPEGSFNKVLNRVKTEGWISKLGDKYQLTPLGEEMLEGREDDQM